MDPLPPAAQPFLAALAENPGDELSRLALADWLEERGDPRAAWVRDAGLWAYMKPDAGNPAPRILDALLDPSLTDDGRTDLFELLDRIGPHAVPAVRVWVRENPEPRFPHAVGYLKYARPPALSPVPSLVSRLQTGSWYDVWEAVVDLGFHGPEAAVAVPAILNAPDHDEWEGFYNYDGWGNGDPLGNAQCRAFGAIGAAAMEAVPWLAEHGWLYEDAYEAILRMRPNPLLVLNNLNTDETHEVLVGVRVVRDLDPTGTSALMQGTVAHSGRIRFCCAEVLGEMGIAAANALPVLREVLRTNTDWDRELAEPYFTAAIEQIEAAMKASGVEAPSLPCPDPLS